MHKYIPCKKLIISIFKTCAYLCVGRIFREKPFLKCKLVGLAAQAPDYYISVWKYKYMQNK